MIHLQVWCQVLEAARISSATSLNSCKLEDISGCVFSTKEVSPKQVRMTWVALSREWGNETTVHGCDGVSFPSFPTKGNPNETAASSGKSRPGINAGLPPSKMLGHWFPGCKKRTNGSPEKSEDWWIDYIYFFANETTTVINLAIMKA